MKNRNQKRNRDTCLLTAEGKNKDSQIVIVPEMMPALFLLAGILFAFRDLMYGNICLAGGLFIGFLIILILQITEASARAFQIARMGIYLAGVLCFLVFILFVAQGFLDMVNRIMVLWNLRFKTELEQFSVDGRVVLGSVVFWCLLAAGLAALLRILVRKRNTGATLLLVMFALFAGFILGRAQMWLSILCLLAGIFSMLIFSAAPGRRYGYRGAVCLLGLVLLFLGLWVITGSYDGLGQIAQWRAGTVDWFGKIRYGEDTLPQGNLRKAPGLLDGDEDTLKVNTEKAQEWYLKGFVGAAYDGSSWKELSMEAYQGEYEGLFQWLETKNFSVLKQYATYDKLDKETDDADSKSIKAEVQNVGAYRKYMYLPSSVQRWTGVGAKEKRDWQVRSDMFFGAREYKFQAVSQAPSADAVLLSAWIDDPSEEEQENYLGAESVYHSFTEDYYMDVEEDLRLLIEEMFFPDPEEMDFNAVTAQIRRVLRQETRYQEKPPASPSGRDFVKWFLLDGKRGNAVHYASTAVLAYRTAGYAARYVEGYHYTEEEAQKLADEGKTRATLTNKNAHAWAEVYIPGAGWLPVEVVPGMYTEMYANQVVEGRPAYQVNSNASEDGLETEEGLIGEGKGNLDEKDGEKEQLSLRKVFSVLLLCLYLAFALYLLLEIQRALRLAHSRRTSLEGGDPAYMDQYVQKLKRLLIMGKITGDYTHPMELSAQVEEKIAGISRGEYERAIQLIQKVRFGGKQLLPYEIHTLDCFAARLLTALKGQRGVWGRLKVRYLYALT